MNSERSADGAYWKRNATELYVIAIDASRLIVTFFLGAPQPGR